MPNVIETTDAAANVLTVYNLGIGQTAQGVIPTTGLAGDHDWYRVNLVAGQTYTFALVGTGAVNQLDDPFLSLRDSAGVVIASNDDDGPGATSSITFTAGTTGSYYLDASAYDGQSMGQYGLSATLGTRASYDEQMGAGILVRSEDFWATPGTGADLTWAVQATLDNITDASGNATTGITLTAVQIAAVQAGLAAFSEVGDLTFTQVNPGGTSDSAVIRVAAYNSTDDGSGAYAYFPGSADFTALAGDVRLNNDSVSTTSIPQGSYSYAAIMHEIGHAMGLSHPGDYNAAEGVSITYENDAQFTQDSYQYTIMSYFDESATTDAFGSTPDTLMMFDILAIQQAYGANMSTRAGNSVYGFGANTGATYNFALNTAPALCIWDGGGIDRIDASGYAMSQVINLNAGSFSTIGGVAGNVSIAFGAVIENAIGGSGDDTLIGNAAANDFKGGAGGDTMTGRGSGDTYYVDNALDKVIELNETGVDRIFSTITYSLSGTYVENLVLTGSANINATGNTMANVLNGNTGANVLNGGGGADTMTGGLGADTYYVDNALDKVIETNQVGIDLVYSKITFSLAGGYAENLTLTGSANINATGNTLANILLGNAGANVLNGATGADTMTGGLGADTYYVENVADKVIELNQTGIDLVYSSVTYSLSGTYAEKLTLTGSANINASGNTQANILTGNAGANVLNGAAGADTMTGGLGADTYYVDNALDKVIELNQTGADLVSSMVSYSLAGTYVENLTLGGSAAINATGNTTNNVLTGNAGANTLTGGKGIDTLTGGGGVDRFVYNSTADSTLSVYDRITDLNDIDIIDLSAIDARTNVAGDNAFVLVDAFTGVSGQMTATYAASSNLTIILMDTNGDKVADMKIVANGNHDDFDHFLF